MTNLKKIFFWGLVVSSSCIFGGDKVEKKDNNLEKDASSSASAKPTRFRLSYDANGCTRSYRKSISPKKSDDALKNPLVQQATTKVDGKQTFNIADFPVLPYGSALIEFPSAACAFAHAEIQDQLNSIFKQVNGVRKQVTALEQPSTTQTTSTSALAPATRARAKSGVPKYSTQVVRIDMNTDESTNKTVGTTSSCTTCLTHESRIGELERQVATLAAMVAGFSIKQDKQKTV